MAELGWCDGHVLVFFFLSLKLFWSDHSVDNVFEDPLEFKWRLCWAFLSDLLFRNENHIFPEIPFTTEVCFMITPIEKMAIKNIKPLERRIMFCPLRNVLRT